MTQRQQWLRENGHRYAGKWLAFRRGQPSPCAAGYDGPRLLLMLRDHGVQDVDAIMQLPADLPAMGLSVAAQDWAQRHDRQASCALWSFLRGALPAGAQPWEGAWNPPPCECTL